ncbi:CCR4-NOT transcription complex subunit 10-A [Lepeophtheirus salmonis]|uniref:CCR4-NOT transcription complex subunit 10-A n=1 Tax=Lepeophtheirus salmonis TaxID=72036 RepID=UPI001AE9E196|nr:CCR4-NOT transcription complex subunit 10-A-like [Lepeophtheirus salmonis]
MEYIKGNPRKAHKLLANLVIENGNSEVDSFYHNNVGIVHIMQDKPNLASHYLQEALEKTIKLFDEEENKKDISEGRTTPEYLLINKKIEITYNLAIALLNSGTYTELSFEYFIKTLPMFQKRPSLWLHMAECCIQSYQQLNSVPTYSDSVASIRDLKHKSTTLTSIGPIQYQKIVLTDSGGHPFTHPGVSVPVPLNPPKNNNLNLDFALSCLRNASVLIKMNRYKQESLFAATLVNHSYVCLLIKDYVTAFHKAQELLDFLVSASTHIKDGSTYKLLGHLYAGEALIYLDRISEATEHLGPLTLQSLDTEMSSGGDESDDCFKKNTPYGGLGFSALNFNLSVAFALRGELDKAKGVLDKSTGPKSVELATKITMMNLYIYIMKKDMKTCREIIQENCDVVKIPFTAQAK